MPDLTPPDAPSGPRPPLGPILRFRGTAPGRIRLAVTVAGPAPDGAGLSPLGALAGTPFHGAELDLPLAGGAARLPEGLRAALPMLPETVHAPGPGGSLRLAFASCNGAEDEEGAAGVPGGRNALWRQLAARHARAPFHLLVMGGDQVYADALWRLPSVAAWARLPRRERLRAPMTEAMRGELEAHYLRTYATVFGSPEVAAMLAGIPSVMMWDDHDIVDGWGSRPASWQAAPVPRGIFAAARRAFALIQRGASPDAPGGFDWSGDLGPARIVVPDLRSARSRRRVMGPEGHAHLVRALEGHGRAHALVVSTVPLVNADLSAVERLMTPLMPLADLYQDDLRDQWMSHAHRAEWRAVMGRLLDASAACRVSVLSGEIHLGAIGTATRGGARVDQFIASGIAHPPPPARLAALFGRFASRTRARGDVGIEMAPLLPDGGRYVPERNWLEVAAHPGGALDVVLHAEVSGPIVLAGAPERRAGAAAR